MNEKEIFSTAEEWLERGLEIVIITVIETWGSVLGQQGAL